MAQCMTNQNRENEQDTRATADDVGLQQCHVSLTAASVTACLQHTRVHTAALYQATAHTSAHCCTVSSYNTHECHTAAMEVTLCQ